MKIVRNYTEKPNLTNCEISERKDEKGNITGYQAVWTLNREAEAILPKLTPEMLKEYAASALDLAIRSRVTPMLQNGDAIEVVEKALDALDFNVSGRVKKSPEEKFIFDALTTVYGKSKDVAKEKVEAAKTAGKLAEVAKKLGFVPPKRVANIDDIV